MKRIISVLAGLSAVAMFGTFVYFAQRPKSNRLVTVLPPGAERKPLPLATGISVPPQVDEHGRKTWAFEAEAIALSADDRNFSVEAPQIRFFPLAGTDERTVLISSGQGRINLDPTRADDAARRKLIATLEERVDIVMDAPGGQVGELLRLKTQDVEWSAAANRAATSHRVAISGPSMELSGSGMQLDLASGMLTILRDIVAEFQVTGEDGVPTLSSDGESESGERYIVSVRCQGPFKLDTSASVACFQSNVVAETDDWRIFSDTLELSSGGGTGSIDAMAARGNVVIVGRTIHATGEAFEWAFADEAGSLVGEPLVHVAWGNEEGEARSVLLRQSGKVIVLVRPRDVRLVMGRDDATERKYATFQCEGEAEFQLETGEATLRDSVVVAGLLGQRELSAQVVRARYATPADGERQLSEAIATGDVAIRGSDGVIGADSISFDRQRRTAVLSGNAYYRDLVADRSVRAANIEAEFDEDGGALSLARLEAVGDVLVTFPEGVFAAREMVWSRADDIVRGEGGPVLNLVSAGLMGGASGTPLRLTCEGPATVELAERKGTFERNVVATQGDRRLACEKLDLSFSDGAGSTAAWRMTSGAAEGNVRLVSEDLRGEANRLTWDRGQEGSYDITLEGNPRLILSQGATQAVPELADEEVVITCEEPIRLLGEREEVSLKGNVTIQAGAWKARSDQALALLGPGTMQLRHVVMDGSSGVTIANPKGVASARRLVMDMGEDRKLLLEGDLQAVWELERNQLRVGGNE